MATRFYLSTTAPAVTPASWDASWNYQNGTLTLGSAPTVADATALANLTHTNNATATAQFGSRARFVSSPLSAQTISGNLSGQIQGSENSTSNNATICVALTVINSAGTKVATLIGVSASDNTAAAPPELTTTLTNRQVQNSAEATSFAISSYACAAGDRIVIEIGVREVRASGTEVLRVGTTASSGDLPVDNTTTTTTYRPWIELSTNLLFAQERTATGIAPTVAYGSPTVTATVTRTPASIAPTAALGTPTVTKTITRSPPSIEPTAAFGTAAPTATVTRTATGIGPTAALGTPGVSTTVTRTTSGIAATAACGTATVLGSVTRPATGITSGAAVGTASIAASVTRQATGIPGLGPLGFGLVTVLCRIERTVSSISSTAALGSAAAVRFPPNRFAASIVSTSLFGTPVVTQRASSSQIASARKISTRQMEKIGKMYGRMRSASRRR